MKKIFALLVVALITFNLSAANDDLDKDVAGASKYKIQLGEGLNYDNKDGYDQPNNTTLFEVVLPVHERFQLAVEGEFNDVLTQAGEWTALNNYGKIAVGIVIVPDKVKLGFYVAGGTEKMLYKKNAAGSSMYQGNGLIDAKVGLFLKSALFDSKIGDVSIRQGVKIRFLGHGYEAGTLAGGPIYASLGRISGATANYSGDVNDARYSGWSYWGEIKFSVPIHSLAGFTNITTFKYSAELEYEVSGNTYTELAAGSSLRFDVKPSEVYGYVFLDNILEIAPDSTTSFKVCVKPRVDLSQGKYVLAGAADQVTFEQVKFSTEFELWGKKSFEIGNVLGIVPYFEMDFKWTLSYNQYYFSNGITSGGLNDFNSGAFKVDPGVKLGLKLGNWETSIKWNPSATYGIASAGTSAAEDDAVVSSSSNIWNLANWAFEVSCEFPPPTK